MEDAKRDALPEVKDDGNQNILGKSTSSASFLLIVQMFTKLLTFFLNQLVIRYISPRVFGIAAYCEFFVANILFISREGIRLAVQRIQVPKSSQKSHNFDTNTLRGTLQSVLNLGYLPVFLSLPVTCVFLYWQHGSNAFLNLFSMSYIKYCFILIAGLILSELLAEPIYLLNQFHLDFKRRSKYESIAIFGRCIVIFCGVVTIKNCEMFKNYDYDGMATIVFVLGQFTYSFTLLILYFGAYYFTSWNSENNSLAIKKITRNLEQFYFDPEVIVFWRSAFLQMIFKQFLTEGDKLLTSYTCTIEDQGIYSVVSNYGSIIARLLFQPIEESIRLLFTRTLSVRNRSNIEGSLETFRYICLFYLNFSILIFVAGYINGSYLLRIILGGKISQWEITNIWDVFPQYIIYIPFMAFNGIFEAFFSSVATVVDIKKFSFFMSFLTVFILGLLYFLIKIEGFGLSGLIISNICNMTLRIIYCSNFFKNFYHDSGLPISFITVMKKVIPKIISGVIAFTAHKFVLGEYRSSRLTDLIKSVLICICLLLHLLYLEKNIIITATKELRRKFFSNIKIKKN